MHAPSLNHLTGSIDAAAALPGTWKLGAGRAITLQPSTPGVLHVARGRLWVTFDGPHAGPLNDQGDHVLDAGGSLRVAAGQRLVIEAWQRSSPARFSWDPLGASERERAINVADVIQPLADLRLALGLGARAVLRLVAGLGRLAWGLLVPRGRDASLADRDLTAQSKACRAHGVMS